MPESGQGFTRHMSDKVQAGQRLRSRLWFEGGEAVRRSKGEYSMKVTRKLSRRSFLGRVAGGAIAGGAALTVLGGRAEAIQVSDSDSGPNADQPGHGRTGVTDSDSGPNSDRPGHGRGRGRTGLTDS